MNKVTTFDLGNYFELPNPGLLAYFSHVRAGTTEDIRPPFWKGKSRQQVLDAWTERLEQLDVDNKMSGLMAFELEMLGKVGPLSIMQPLKERIPKIEEYYTDVTLPSQPIDDRAIGAFVATLKGVRIQRASAKSTIERMRLSTNSGAPYFNSKRRNVLTESLQLLDSGRYHELSVTDLPAVLGWRGQEGGPTVDDVKQRVVWMFPFTTNVAELSVYNPLIRDWQSRNINSAYISMRAVEEKITKLFDTKGDEYVVVTDFSGFDQHFNKHLQDAAYLCLKYQLYQPEEWLEQIFPVKYRIPLVCDTHLMYTGHHGMGSGSGGTNFDECCSHGCMQHEAAILHGARLNPYSNAYGDDGYLSYKGIDVDDVISTYTSHGQVMNPSKQSVDKHSAVYLRRYFHDSYRDKQGIMLGVYSTCRALGRLLGQERFIKFKEDSYDYARYVILRALSIIENCANSPIFEESVDYWFTAPSMKSLLRSKVLHNSPIVNARPCVLQGLGVTQKIRIDFCESLDLLW
nr:RNA-dependent RNA polymerase [Picobirnavirus sp.]